MPIRMAAPTDQTDKSVCGKPSVNPLGDEPSGGKLRLDATRFSKANPLPPVSMIASGEH